jgi:hypothetical protein
VHYLAVASNMFGFGERLYWTAGVTPKRWTSEAAPSLFHNQ